MKALRFILASALLSLGATGCSTTFFATGSDAYADDLYLTHDRSQIARRKQAEAEAARLEAEARKAQWEAMLAEAEAASARDGYERYTYSNVLADTYESAYARRLRGFRSPTYRMPSSYYDLRYSPAYHYVTAYDPLNYNIVVMGDEIWVEPKYISSMFGYWGAPTFAVYTGWGWPYYSFGYAPWGYPHYSWWDWYYDWSWNFGWGWGWHHGPGWGAPHPPHGGRPTPHYPNYRPWGGQSGYRGLAGTNSSSPGTGNYRGSGTTGRSTGTAVGNSPRRNGAVDYRNNNTRPDRNTQTYDRNGNSNYRTGSGSNYRPSGTGSSGGGYRPSGGQSGSSGSRGGGNYRR